MPDGTILSIGIDRQFTLTAFEELVSLDAQVSNVLDNAGTVTWISNLCLTSALRYLWKMINLFQFLVFIADWELMYPSNARIILTKVQNLIFLDWLPTDVLIIWLSEKIGIEEECTSEGGACDT